MESIQSSFQVFWEFKVDTWEEIVIERFSAYKDMEYKMSLTIHFLDLFLAICILY